MLPKLISLNNIDIKQYHKYNYCSLTPVYYETEHQNTWVHIESTEEKITSDIGSKIQIRVKFHNTCDTTFNKVNIKFYSELGFSRPKPEHDQGQVYQEDLGSIYNVKPDERRSIDLEAQSMSDGKLGDYELEVTAASTDIAGGYEPQQEIHYTVTLT